MDATRINYYLAVLLALLVIAALGLQLRSAYSTYQYAPSTSTTAPKARPTDVIDYQASTVTSSHLFGRLPDDYRLTDSATIPTTSMQLLLRGAFTSTRREHGSAIIEGPDGQTRSYRVGSRLYGQAQLQQVYADRVVLSRNGQLETLYFPINQTTDEDTNTSQYTGSALAENIPNGIKEFVRDNMSQQEIDQTVTQLSSAAMTPEQRQALIRKRLQDLRNRAREKQ